MIDLSRYEAVAYHIIANLARFASEQPKAWQVGHFERRPRDVAQRLTRLWIRNMGRAEETQHPGSRVMGPPGSARTVWAVDARRAHAHGDVDAARNPSTLALTLARQRPNALLGSLMLGSL
jgi:hypothetical protein